MNREIGRRARGLSVAMSLVGLSLLGTSASWAQQKPLKEQLTGAWTMVSIEVTTKDGKKGPGITGTNPNGVLIMDASGRYAWVIGPSDRPHLTTLARSKISAEELAAATKDLIAAHGTWSVDEAGKTLTRKNQLALLPNNDKQETKAAIALSGNELKLVSVASTGVTSEQIFRRAK